MTHPLDPFTFILDSDRKPVQHANDDAWFEWFMHMDNRRVAESMIGADVRVSTVFAGIDRSYGNGPRLLFETHIFGGEFDDLDGEWLTATWAEAEAKHAEVVATLMNKDKGDAYDRTQDLANRD